MTKRKFIAVCKRVEEGWTITRACQAEGISYRNFRTRVSNNARLQRRLSEAETTRLELRREEAVAAILEAGQKSWMAYAWFLERVFPNSFALRSVARPDSEQDEPEPELPAEVLARHRALMLEQAREDEARQAANRSSELAG